MKREALLSTCQQYRYTLTRSWDETKPQIAFVGLNPSTADAFIDDPTIRRCIEFAKREDFGSMLMVNLFAYRATDPGELYEAADPIGPDNNEHLKNAFSTARKVVFCWGINGRIKNRDRFIIEMFNIGEVYCFGQTMNGFPKHPLYLKNDTPLILFKP